MVMLTALLNFLHRRFHRPCHVIGAGSWNAAVGVWDAASGVELFSLRGHLQNVTGVAFTASDITTGTPARTGYADQSPVHDVEGKKQKS